MNYLFKSFRELLLNLSSKSLMRLFKRALSSLLSLLSFKKSKRSKVKKAITAKQRGIKKSWIKQDKEVKTTTIARSIFLLFIYEIIALNYWRSRRCH